MRKFLSLVSVLVICATASAKFEVRQPCSDGMVLQQNSQAVVWGKADPGCKVTVRPSWNDGSYREMADSQGFWQVKVSTPEASYTHHSIKLYCGTDSLVISNVLIGEVWLASGQSNMEMPLKGFFNCPVDGFAEVVSGAPLRDKVRMFKVPLGRTQEPLTEIDGQWWCADDSNVAQMSATAFFFARKLSESLDVPIGILFSAYGGTKVESWLPKELVDQYPDVKTDKKSIDALPYYKSPFMMYNAMICPIKGYTIRGIIWYQGCSNVGTDATYADRLEKMVSVWREDWNDANASIPFYQVEIAPCTYNSEGQKGRAALLRKSQHDAVAKIPNSGIVVTNDLMKPYESGQIHPSRKLEVGERLAYLALNRDYGMTSVPCYAPEAVRVFRKEGMEGAILVEIKNCPNGIDRQKAIEGLEVAGSDGVFKPVTEASYGYKPLALVIRCDDVPDPCIVRYGWGDFKPGNIHNTDGLPLVPFELSL